MPLGVFKQDVSPEVCLRFPGMAKESVYWLLHGNSRGLICEFQDDHFLIKRILWIKVMKLMPPTCDPSNMLTSTAVSIVWTSLQKL
ncbi:hypothetical protein OPV22_027313 [Ensete ventricosum]|uniref:Uncharacterized protein n=1 Tax=Ensete ventricosum TaxID=4639 RepID=A0AAV8P423_ENSVE|nr:hypothetical protein OPV22_027313 [Ensete ventricosum]